MLLGTCFRMTNYTRERKIVDLIFEALTQFVMLIALFGLMDWMIIAKWLKNWDEFPDEQPPGVIVAMITMFLNGGVFVQPVHQKPYGDFLPNQTSLMQYCVIIAFTCVPLMLLVKPCYYWKFGHKVHDDDY